MTTVKQIVLPHQKKSDNTWNVKIRLTHKRKSKYMDTAYFVNAKQLEKNFAIKDSFILKQVIDVVEGYRTKLNNWGSKFDYLDVWELADKLNEQEEVKPEEIKPETVNVIAFGKNRIQELRELKRNSSAANMVTVVNSLVDYFHSDFVPITAITAKMLLKYEAFLRRPRILERASQFGRPVITDEPGLTDNGIYCHFRDLRILFNNVKDHYNDEDLGIVVIKHYPFKKYKIKRYKPRRKKKLTLAQVQSIRDMVVPRNSRIEQARDLFMLSFYLCGMNAVDLYKIPRTAIAPKRIEYLRSKTTGRRTDEAFISIKLIKEARTLYLKYAGKLAERYGTYRALDQAIAIGIRSIGKSLKISDLEFYDARHAFADIARNKCRFAVYDIALALNHIDDENTVTDMYLSKDWSIIDEIQAAVVSLINRAVIKKQVQRTV